MAEKIFSRILTTMRILPMDYGDFSWISLTDGTHHATIIVLRRDACRCHIITIDNEGFYF